MPNVLSDFRPQPVHLFRARALEHLRDERLAEPPFGRATPERTLRITSCPPSVSIEAAGRTARLRRPSTRSCRNGRSGRGRRWRRRSSRAGTRGGSVVVCAYLTMRSSLSYSRCLRFSRAAKSISRSRGCRLAVDHADGVAAERGDVVDRQLGRPGHGVARPSAGRSSPSAAAKIVGMEIDGLGVPAVDQPFEAEQDDPLHVRPAGRAGRRGCRLVAASALIRTIAMFSRGRNRSIAARRFPAVLRAVPTAESSRSIPVGSLISAWVSSIGSASSVRRKL